MNQVYKNLALWMVIGLIVILLFTVFQGAQQSGQEQPNFSEFLKAVEQGRVDSVVIRGNLVTYTLKDSASTQRTYIVDYPDLIKQLRERGVRIAVKPPDSNPWYAIFLQWVPMLLFIGVWIFFMRQMQGGGAKAIAGEANVPFFSISGSDFVEMFVGVGASRVRDLFEQGKKNAPCIIFMDEIDAVGRHRGAGLGGGHDEREQTLNQLLVEMDGFETNEGVILMAATNRPDVLDPALLRPGRFDRRVVVSRPDVRGREEILRVHTRKIPLADDVDLFVLARGTPGFSGADLANMVNEAALAAARQNRKAVLMYDFEVAKDKVLMGVERKSLLLSDEEKKNTAYHEAGHALVAAMLPHSDPVHKVTIIPRGMALGLTMQLPTDDRHNYYKNYLDTQIAILMGGRLAEELFLNCMSTGAGNDIERATDLARKMVCEWGMSDLGPLTFGKKEEQIFLGREINQHRDYSEDTAIKIDQEVRKMVSAGYNTAKQILSDNRETLDRIARALIEREVLDAVEVKMLVEGTSLPPIKPLPTNDGVQQVIKPDPGRSPVKGGERPAT